jgi:hypothetical protein
MQDGMAVQAHHPAVAIDKRMDPPQPSMRGRHGQQGGLAAPHTAKKRAPSFHEGRHTVTDRCHMLANADLAGAQLAGHDRLAFVGEQITGGQARKQRLMQGLDRIRRVKLRGGAGAAVPGLDLLLGADMGYRQPLSGRELGIGGKVLAQGLLDLVRPGVLALDPVGVVRVHAAQQLTQLDRNLPA